ncbi:MAG: LbtU family siderophore porin [Deltaproteobacteria bacterium]|nr:LbtU family siderophore porin [Deltaproteobacteria bacterium]
MKKRISMTAIALLAGVSTGWAADNADLEKQVLELARQNRMLLERVVELERIVAGQEPPAKGLAEKTNIHEEKESVEKRLRQIEAALDGKLESESGDVEKNLARRINDHVELSGLVEVEVNSSENFAGEESSDINLATVELGIDATISDWSQAHVVLLHEEGEEDEHVTVDEALITVGNTEEFPAYLTAGRMYLPFGSYVTNMVSDTLPHEIGETGDSGVLTGFQVSGFYGSLYAFNGDIREQGEDDRIDAWGASLGYAHEGEQFSLDAALDWLNSIGDSDGLGDYLQDNTGNEETDEYVQGFAAHLLLQYGPFDVVAEYVRALDAFTTAEIAFNGSGAEPRAWSLEAGWTFDLLTRQTIFSLSWQGTDEALALGLPEDRYMAAVRMFLLSNTSVALEYLHDEDYDLAAGGTGDDGDSATMQVAVEF